MVSEELSSELYFAPFVMDVVVPLLGNCVKVPVKIPQDTSASQSFLLEGVFLLCDESAEGSDNPVLGFGMKNIGVLLHKILVESGLVSGELAVGVCQGLPIKGVAFLMGND